MGKAVKKTLAGITLGMALSLAPASAWANSLYELPTNWRLQQYIGGAVAVWFTTSGCTNGNLGFGSATPAEVDRFWSLVLAAKLANRKVGVYFTGCTIDSFYIEQP